MSRELTLHFGNKLSNEWSASSVTGLLSDFVIKYLSSPEKWKALDSSARIRLVLSPLFLRLKELEELHEPLSVLKDAAASDVDDWVRAIAAAVGPYDGRLHIKEVIKSNTMVKNTLDEVQRHGAHADPTIYRPLEEKYLSSIVTKIRRAEMLQSDIHANFHPENELEKNSLKKHGHFVPRNASEAPRTTMPGSAPSSQLPSSHPTQPKAMPPAVVNPATAMFAKPPRPFMGMTKRVLPGLPGSRNTPITTATSNTTTSNTATANVTTITTGNLHLKRISKFAAPTTIKTTTSTRIGSSGLSSKFTSRKKTALIDVEAVAELNKAVREQREREQKHIEDEKAEIKAAKIAEKEAQKAAKQKERERILNAKKMGSQSVKKKKEIDPEKKETKEEKKAVDTDGDNNNNNVVGDGDTNNGSDVLPQDTKRKQEKKVSTQKRRAPDTASSHDMQEQDPLHSSADADKEHKRPPKTQKTLKTSTAPMPLLDPSIAAEALEKAAMLADEEAAGLVTDPILMKYMQFGDDDDFD